MKANKLTTTIIIVGLVLGTFLISTFRKDRVLMKTNFLGASLNLEAEDRAERYTRLPAAPTQRTPRAPERPQEPIE